MCKTHYDQWRRSDEFELKDHHEGNKRAIAYYTGVIDARNGRPRRVDIADNSIIGDAYTRGYDTISPHIKVSAA
jgi:hypothetical protein